MTLRTQPLTFRNSVKSCKGWLGLRCPAYGCVCNIYFCERKLTYLFVTFEMMGGDVGDVRTEEDTRYQV